MPTFPKVIVPIELLMHQGVQTLIQAGMATNSYSIQVTQATQATNNLNAAIGKGIGSYIVFRTAMRLATGVIREGISASAEQEVVLNRLRIIMKLNSDEMNIFRRQAEELSGTLGVLGASDVLQLFEQLSH